MNKVYPKMVLSTLLRNGIAPLLTGAILIYIIPYAILKEVDMAGLYAIDTLIANFSLVKDKNLFIFNLVSILMPIMITTNVFRHMYVKEEKDLFLDKVSRARLFNSNIYTTIILIFCPIFIAFFGCFIFNLQSYIPFFHILNFFLIMLCYQLFISGITTIIIVTIRGVIPQIALIVSTLIFPLLFEFVISNSLENMLTGCVLDLGYLGKILRMFPIYHFALNSFAVNIFEIIMVLIIAFFAFSISHKIFVQNIPKSSKGFVRNSKLKPFFRFLFFSFLSLISIVVAKNSFVILTICSIINVVICEFLLTEELNFNKNQKWYFLFIGIILFVFSVFRFDIYDISERQIYIDEVENIYIGTNYYNIDRCLNSGKENTVYFELPNNNIKFSGSLSPDKINKVINMHNDLISKPWGKNGDTIYISYHLKNDKNIIRRYKFNIENYEEIFNNY